MKEDLRESSRKIFVLNRFTAICQKCLIEEIMASNNPLKELEVYGCIGFT